MHQEMPMVRTRRSGCCRPCSLSFRCQSSLYCRLLAVPRVTVELAAYRDSDMDGEGKGCGPVQQDKVGIEEGRKRRRDTYAYCNSGQ